MALLKRVAEPCRKRVPPRARWRGPVALRVTGAHTSEAAVLRDLLTRVRCDGVPVADVAHLGGPRVAAVERAGLLLAIRPRRVPHGCSRRAWARRYEGLFWRLRDAYRLRALSRGLSRGSRP